MSTGMLHLHSFIPYLFLVLLVYTFVSSLLGWQQGKSPSATQLKISKVTFILSHVQLVVGLVLWFVGTPFNTLKAANSFGDVMKDPALRELVMEHPLTMIIGIAILSVGYIQSKKLEGPAQNKKIALFYGFALVLFMAMIPWDRWF